MGNDDALDAARYRKIRDRAQCDEKHGNGFTVSKDKLKSAFAFRYWCSADELDRLIDEYPTR